MAYNAKSIVIIDDKVYNFKEVGFCNIVIDFNSKEDMLHFAKWQKQYSLASKEEKNLYKKDIEFETDTHIGKFIKSTPNNSYVDINFGIFCYDRMEYKWKDEI